jgi:hypothetical protein
MDEFIGFTDETPDRIINSVDKQHQEIKLMNEAVAVDAFSELKNDNSVQANSAQSKNTPIVKGEFIGFAEVQERVLNRPKLNKSILDGTNDEDVAKNLIKFHIADKSGIDDVENADYDGLVSSYLGADHKGKNPQEILKVIRGTIKPEEEPNYNTFIKFQKMSQEEKLKVAIDALHGSDSLDLYKKEKLSKMSEEDRNKYSKIYNDSMSGIEIYKKSKIAKMSEADKEKYINAHNAKLFSQSRKAVIIQAEKTLSEDAKKVARRALIEKDINTSTWNRLKDKERQLLPAYMRALNPDLAGKFFNEAWERIGESWKNAGEAIVSTIDNVNPSPSRNDLDLYYAFLDKFGKDFDFNDPENAEQLEKFAVDVVQKDIEDKKEGVMFLEPGLAMSGNSKEEQALIDNTRKNFLARLSTGKNIIDQKRLSRKVNDLTKTHFKDGSLPRQMFMASAEMAVDLGGAIGSGFVAGPVGVGMYSGSRFYGELTDTLMDHGVKPSNARALGMVATLPYVAIEQLQVSQLTGVEKKVVERFAKGWTKNIGSVAKETGKDFLKNWTAETAEETAQSIIEASAKAYAKEFLGAEGIEYKDLINDVANEFVGAAKGMFLISATGTGVKATRAALNDYNSGFNFFDEATAIVDEAKQNGEIQQDANSTQFIEDVKNLNSNVIREYKHADTQEEKRAILQEAGVKPEEVERQIKSMDEHITVLRKVSELTDQEEKHIRSEEERINTKLKENSDKVTEFSDLYKDNVDLIRTDDGFQLVGKGSKADVKLNVKFDDNMQQPGSWDGQTINLGKNSDSPVFSHEVTHAMRDLGYITDAEWQILGEVAQEYHGADGVASLVKAYKNQVNQELSGDHLNHELIANMIEDVRAGLSKLPQQHRNIFQKIVDFFKDLVSSVTQGKYTASKNTVVKNIYTGKPFKRKIKTPVNREIHRDKAENKETGDNFVDTNKKVKEAKNTEELPQEYFENLDKELSEYEEYVKEEVKEEADEYEAFLKEIEEQHKDYSHGRIKSIKDYVKGRLLVTDSLKEQARHMEVNQSFWTMTTKDKSRGRAYDLILKDLEELGLIEDANKDEEYLINLLMGNHSRFALNKENQTETEEFKKWFGDSKVVDDYGKPLVVYHGTNLGFNKFDNYYSAQGVHWFSSNRDKITSGGSGAASSKIIKDVYLSAKKLAGWDEYEKYGLQEIQDLGFDGIKLDDDYVVFEPTQIKSATDNNGQFDGSNPDIRFAINKEDQTETEAFKKWFGDSKVVDEDGKPLVVYHGTNVEFNEFKKDLIGKNYTPHYGDGFYFSARPMGAFEYGSKIKSTYLSIKNPAIFSLKDVHKASGEGVGYTDYIKSLGHDGIIYMGNPQIPQYIAFSPTQIKSATDNNGQFDGSNPDIRFAINRDITATATSTILAREFYKENITDDQALKIAKQVGVKDAEQVVHNAHILAEETRATVKDAQNDEEILNAIRKKAIQNRYQERIKSIYDEGLKKGELYQKAQTQLREAKSLLKQQEINKVEPIADINDYINTVKSYMYEGPGTGQKVIERKEKEIETEEELEKVEQKPARLSKDDYVEADGIKLIEAIQEQAKKELIDSKIIRENNQKSYLSNPVFIGKFKASMVKILNELVRDLVPGAKKVITINEIKELKKLNNTKAVEAKSLVLLERIGKERIKQTRTDAIKDLNNLLKRFRTKPSARVEQKDRKIAADKHTYLYEAYKALWLSPEKIKEEWQNINDTISRHVSSANIAEKQLYHEAVMKADVMNNFAGLRYETRPTTDAIDALEKAKDIFDKGKYEVESLLEERAETIGLISEEFTKAIKEAQETIKKKPESGKISAHLISYMHTIGAIQDSVRYSDSKEIQKQIKELDGRINRATYGKIKYIQEVMEKVEDGIADIYGLDKVGMLKLATGTTNSSKIINQLNQINPEYSKYSSDGRISLSKSHLMFQIAMMEQQHYQSIATRKDEEGKATNELLAKRLKMLPEMKAELNAQELAVIELLKEVIAENTPELIKSVRKVTGMDLKVTEPEYFPGAIRPRLSGFEQFNSMVQLIPGGLEPRVPHSRDLNEEATIFDIFGGHIRDTAHFIHMSDVSIDMRGIFGTESYRTTLASTYGDVYANALMSKITDTALDDALIKDSNSELINKLRAFVSIKWMWGSMKSALGQLSGGVAMSMQLGPLGFFNMTKEVLNTKEFFNSFKKILSSAIIKNRLATGYNEAMENAIRQAEKKGTLGKVIKAGMIFPGMGDALTSSFFGAMYYQQLINSKDYQAYSDAEKEQRAMSEVFALVEITQQSTHAAYMPDLIRRGGSFTKSFTQFQTSIMQQFGFEAKAIREALAKKDAESIKKAAVMVFVNHIVLPSTWWLASTAFQSMLGDDLDEEDLLELTISCLLGPARGIIYLGFTGDALFNYLLETDKSRFGSNSMALDSVVGDSIQSFELMSAFYSMDMAEIIEETDRLLKRLIRPYAHIRKFQENQNE